MKRILLISLSAALGAAANPNHYVNFVRQIQQDSGVEWDVTVASSGTMLSQEGVGPSGSLFQLWSIHSFTADEYHLDEEYVSSYTPNAAISIQTGDPYPHVARTRVDQPFTVRMEISGLLSGLGGGAGVPASARQVLLEHAAGNYPAGRHGFPANEADPEGEENTRPIGTAMINGNGNFVLNYGFTSLRGPDLTKIEGEEKWTIYALDEGANVGDPLLRGDVLQSAVLQVWPIADATISGLDLAEKYSELPPLTVTLNDLYPDSTTFVRVYWGAPTSSPQDATDVVTSFVIIQDSIPQDRILTLEDLDSYFPKVGSYTIEILHQTPFGIDLLGQIYPVQIERIIKVRGSVYTKE